VGTVKHLLETHVYRLGLIDQLDSNDSIHTKLCTNKMYTESILSLLLQEICFKKLYIMLIVINLKSALRKILYTTTKT
jgi:hypothetical protein